MEHFKNLTDYLLDYRAFNPENYIEQKVKAINDFFKDNDLDSCVIGISGGVDSAVVYRLLKLASETQGSPIKKIIPTFMPIYSQGITGQDEARALAVKVIHTGILHINDLSQISKLYGRMFDDISFWTQGQIDSIIRTPMLYGLAAYLQQDGYKSIVVGTTNRDEGAYIGFYGKASDAMVDLQPIGDIHKMEVYQIAKLLDVPQEIIDRPPTGDVFDASLDEETIGAPYWFIQIYLLFKERYSNPDIVLDALKFLTELNDEEQKLWGKYSTNIENLHKKNKHKYDVGQPSHFIDVMPRAIKNGWK